MLRLEYLWNGVWGLVAESGSVIARVMAETSEDLWNLVQFGECLVGPDNIVFSDAATIIL